MTAVFGPAVTATVDALVTTERHFVELAAGLYPVGLAAANVGVGATPSLAGAALA